MLFTSFSYLIFLPIVFIIYWILSHKYRWILLLVASYFFYMSWSAKYAVIILFTTIITYLIAILIERASSINKGRILLGGALLICLGILFIFKYLNFFCTSIMTLVSNFGIFVEPYTIKLILPVGISFYTFQTLSYVIDVYRGNIVAETHFGRYALFVSFFPQLVAGPIERSTQLIPQLKEEKHFDYKMATYGMRLILWGVFKKSIIADRLAYYVDSVFDSLITFQGFSLFLAVFFFAIQIYCDFSGYSDIAVGSANLLGIQLSTNFKSPYFSTSIKEFWNRWHISLSTWFRDYIYIPLGGSRVGTFRHILNILITFAVSGFKRTIKLHGLFLIRSTFTFIFCILAWTFFRAYSVESSLYIFKNMFSGIFHPSTYFLNGIAALQLNRLDLIKIFVPIIGLGFYDFFSIKNNLLVQIKHVPLVPRYAIYIGMILIIIFLMPVNAQQEFVYFQF